MKKIKAIKERYKKLDLEYKEEIWCCMILGICLLSTILFIIICGELGIIKPI